MHWWWCTFRIWLRSRLRGAAVRHEIASELSYHIEMRTRDLVAAGMALGAARREALERFGSVERTRAECGDLLFVDPTPDGAGTMTQGLRDLKYAVRSMVKNPGFTLVVVITLGLGIGANTAIFSVVNGVLLDPLPYHEPEGLVSVFENDRLRGTTQEGVSAPDYFDLTERNRVFADAATWFRPRLTLTGADNEPQRVISASLTYNLFSVLGVTPALGRSFTAEEDQPGGERVVVLSHGLWNTRFGSDPNILGRSITVDEEPYEIIGVMPADFDFPLPDTDLFTPLQAVPTTYSRGMHSFGVVARLGDGISHEQASADVSRIARALEEEYPDDNLGRGMWVEPLTESRVGDVRTALLMLLGAVTLVLLIACVNVANLLFARASVREREVAIRTALGAGRGRLIKQLLTESMVLALVGGVVGLLVAFWGVNVLVAIGPDNLPRLHNVAINGGVLAFAFLTTAGTGLVFGLLPALKTARSDLHAPLKEGGRSATSGVGGYRLRGGLVVAEIALAVLLVTGAGLLIKSFWRLQQVDPGFNPSNVLSLTLNLPAARYPQEFATFPQWTEIRQFQDDLEQRVRNLPGVEAVALALNHPVLAGWTTRFTIEGRPPVAEGEQEEARIRPVTPDYFRTVGIPVLRGRGLTDQDRGDAPFVLVINEAFARRYFQDEDPLGKRMTVWRKTGEIVGVAQDVKWLGLDQPAPPGWYMPLHYMPFAGFNLVVRTSGDPLGLVPEIRSRIGDLDPALAPYNITTLETELGKSVAQQRFNMLLLAAFAVLAMALAAVGIYGVMSYGVSQRTHEIGVRMSLGARQGDVLRDIVLSGLKLTGIGVAAGLVATVFAARTVSSLLFGVGSVDLPTFGAVAVILALVATLASYLPAHRASRVDPVEALRYE